MKQQQILKRNEHASAFRSTVEIRTEAVNEFHTLDTKTKELRNERIAFSCNSLTKKRFKIHKEEKRNAINSHIESADHR